MTYDGASSVRRRHGVDLCFEGPGKAGQAVIGDWLPNGGAGDVHATHRSHPGVAVEGSHADVDDLRVLRVL